MQFLTSTVFLAMLGVATAANLKTAVLLCPNAELTFSDPTKNMPAIGCMRVFGCGSGTDGVKSGNIWTASCLECPADQQVGKLNVLSQVLHESCIRKRSEGLPGWVPDWDATIDNRRASEDMKPEWIVQDSGHVITRGLEIAEIHATAPGYPSIIPGSTLGGKTVINEWRRLAGLSAFSHVSPIDTTSCSKREHVFKNALSGGFASMKWPQGSLEYTKSYHAWLEWFVSSEVALAKSCKQVMQDFDQLIWQTSERRRFIVSTDGQMGLGPEGAEKVNVTLIIPGGGRFRMF
ncbi:heterokaryon incompatibility (het-6OR allele) [Fusarium mundagurra]|uniref:Heterokaryon incompatibility (Het-6OR allele) n=1 Tax=Fusarium mundagurra TaxID=1567541 RepID=A0A8H5YKG6_9HYPO|nr:heterokaryon incompatibility (het-6OR allele) [Fusarium mundagurra]